MFSELTKTLKSPSSLITDETECAKYSGDATSFVNLPRAVLVAESTDDVVTAIKFCGDQNIAVTPRGAGTGLSGGCVPSTNALVISTERLINLEIRPDDEMAICGPGIITRDLMNAASEFGLTYPPDPASYGESTLGGNVAENAGGLRCKRFGLTKDYVLGLEVVTAKGEILNTGWFNDYKGFALSDILSGSEGTLAVITNIALQLIPQPRKGATILIAFDNPRQAAQTVTDITTGGLIPTILEFLDGDAAACSNSYEKTEGLDSAGSILLIETGGENPDEQTETIRKIAEANSCSYLRVENSDERVEELWKVRRNLSKAVKAISPINISEDVAVPISKFPALVEFVAEMNNRSELRINSFGHAGDGNLHVYFIADKDKPKQEKLIEAGIEALIKRTLELGGTITGEHGIGLAKRNFLAQEFDEATLEAMRSVKSAFDPKNMLNPDKLFPDRI